MADFDINQHLMQMRFGQGGGGGESGTGEAMTPETLIKKGLDKTIQTWVCKVLGVGVNPDIDGKSALSGFDIQAHANSMTPTNATVFRDLRGGIVASILNYFTREFGYLLGSGDAISAGGGGDFGGGGGGGGGDAGGGGGGGGGGDAGGGGGASHGGGGDFHNHMPAAAAGGPEPDMRVSYGDRMVSADSLVGDLGNLRPTPTPTAASAERDTGMSV